MSGIGAAVAGLWAFVRKLEATAGNIANAATDGYKGERATLIEDGTGLPAVHVTFDQSPGASIQDPYGPVRETSNVELSREIPELLIAKKGYEANLKALTVQDELLGSLFDVIA